MKKLYPRILLLVFSICPLTIFSQLNNGGINAYFGVDGDVRSNYVKYGPSTGLIPSDDWFSAIASGVNVIDTSNASAYLTFLQGGGNMFFNKRMSVPLYSKINGKLWLDAVYGRDYISTSPLFDSTIFTIAAKNGDNPVNWIGGTSNIPDKNDLLDVYAHMRRDGLTVFDSLWLFTGVSTVGVSGSRYFDIELYKNNFAYNSATGNFITAGPDAGHTQWKFDAAGNIIQTGDMILAVNYTPGMAPVVDLRIWVSQTTFSTIIPARFNFGAVLDGATPAFGYVSIISKAGTTAFGSGIANFSATPANDTTASPPWGTEQATKNWGMQYQSLQLIEIGLNLTRIGVDPALYTSVGMDPCQSLFSDIFFKSRSSNSFTSNMQDFVEPLTFLRNPVMDFSLPPDTLRCNRTAGLLQITNNSTAGYYTWKTTNGNITGSNSDSTQINLNKPGTYIVSAAPTVGCTVTRRDTIVVPIDTFPPEASILAGLGPSFSYIQFYGGDTAASNYPTPFGGCKGLLWDWSGPGGFSSTIQNPTNDTTWGTYQLIVTEKRNGCTDTATKTLSLADFGVLASLYLKLDGTYSNPNVLLHWQDRNANNVEHYEIEKSVNGTDFIQIGAQAGVSGIDSSSYIFSFADQHPANGYNLYRIKANEKNSQIIYSNILSVKADGSGIDRIYLSNDMSGHSASLVVNTQQAHQGTIIIYNSIGQQLVHRSVQLSSGMNIISLNEINGMKNSAIVVSLLLDKKLAFSQKTIF